MPKMIRLITQKGYDFYVCASALQKAIRRGNAELAGYFGLELYDSGYKYYVWERLMVVSCEDCYGIIIKEIMSIYEAWNFANRKDKTNLKRGRVMVSKAIILLCQAKKCRDADHLNMLKNYDKFDDNNISKFLETIDKKEKLEVPEYVYDCHTYQGKKKGKTKADFLYEEWKSLQNCEEGLFDDVPDLIRQTFTKD